MNQHEINDAVDFIYKQGAKYAEAKGHRIYLEEFRKSQKAMLMQEALEQGRVKTAAAAEVYAYAHSAYVQILKGLQAAVEKEETLRFALVAAQARVEVWRSIQASNRVMDRAVA